MSNGNDDDNVCSVLPAFIAHDGEFVFQDPNNHGKHWHETCDGDETTADSTPFLLLERVASIVDKDSVGKLSEQTVVYAQEASTHTRNGNLHRCSSSRLHSQKSTRASIDLLPLGTLSFHNINYIVGGTSRNPARRKLYPSCMRPQLGKQILRDVSGFFTVGMNAIMGKNVLFWQHFKTIY